MKTLKYTLISVFFVLSFVSNIAKADTALAMGRTLRIGSRGEDVVALQKILINKGFLSAKADGVFGRMTAKAVQKFQTNIGIKSDGIAGFNTQSQLATQAPLITNKLADTTTISSNNPDCNKKDYTMGIVLVIKNTNNSILGNYKEKLDFVKSNFPWAFNFATGGLATMSIPNDPVILDPTGLTSNGTLDLNATLKKFYESSPDNFDFVTIFSDYGGDNQSSYHVNVKNNIQGIGLSIQDNTTSYGSKGRLMGINYMSDPNDNMFNQSCYTKQKNNFNSLNWETACGLDLILHETEHQWAAYVGDRVTGYDDPSKVDLGILTEAGGHYYRGLSAPEGTRDPISGAVHWKKSLDHDYIPDNDNINNFDIFKYHPFTLYFMGLLPQSEYDKKFDIMQNSSRYELTLPDGRSFDQESMKSIYKQVSVRDLISKGGQRICQ